MTTLLFLQALALTLATQSATPPPVPMHPTHPGHPGTQGLGQAESAALHARFDADLGALRAGRVDAPAPFAACERAGLASAQERSRSLEALRAAGEPTDHEWKWLGIGAAIVVLIILL